MGKKSYRNFPPKKFKNVFITGASAEPRGRIDTLDLGFCFKLEELLVVPLYPGEKKELNEKIKIELVIAMLI